jgi:AcrR family transcriptional regulator
MEEFRQRQIEKAMAKGEELQATAETAVSERVSDSIAKAMARRMARLDRHLARRAVADQRKGARLGREQIAAAALAIADVQGFDAVTMRKIAAVLGSGTMSLYHYVRTKEDLVALMDEAIMGEVLIPTERLPGHWRQALTAIAERTRDVFRRHPWAMTALIQGRPGPNGMKHIEQSLTALKDTKLGPEEKFAVLMMVDDYVFGHTLRLNARQSIAGSDGRAAAKRMLELAAAELGTGEYPELEAIVGGDPEAAFKRFGDSVRDSRFEGGLEALLDGAAAKYHLPD